MYLAIELWLESGLTQRGFCEKEGLNYQVFGYWLKKFRREAAPENGKGNGFIELNMKAPTGAEGIAIRYPNGVVLTCNENLPPQKLKTLIGLY